jgi:hypothetical protein
MNIARQSTFYPVGSHVGRGSKATFGLAPRYFGPIRRPPQDRAGTETAPCRDILGTAAAMSLKDYGFGHAGSEHMRACGGVGASDTARAARSGIDIGEQRCRALQRIVGRQAATSHNLDEPLIRVLRPVGVITGKLSLIAARRSAMSCASTNGLRLETPDAGTRSAFNVSH